MCGIFACLSQGELSQDDLEKLSVAADKIQYRGPDDTKHVKISERVFYGFHRLAINGLDHASDEPLYGGFKEGDAPSPSDPLVPSRGVRVPGSNTGDTP